MSKLSIAYIYTSLVTVGGTDRVIIDKANYFADKLEYDVYIITDTQLGRPTVFPLSSKVKLIDLNLNFFQQYGHIFPIRAFYYIKLMHKYKKMLYKKLEELNPDIVISTMGREMDFITSFKKTGRSIIGEAHVNKEFIRNFHLIRQKGGLYKILANYWIHKQERNTSKLDALVVLTNYDADNWKKIAKTIVIPNFYPFYPKILKGYKYGKTVITVGRYSEEKGFDLLLYAWKKVYEKHKDWNLNIFGCGILKDQYEKQINELDLSDVIHLKPPTKNIQQEYEKSDFYVLSSRFEGFGMVLIEAMTCGIPCVSFCCPHGPSDIIKNNIDGILVKNGDIEALALGINQMIENEKKRLSMGEAARINVLRYSPQIIMPQWDKLFHSLIRNKNI